jgi:hypothetical protein
MSRWKMKVLWPGEAAVEWERSGWIWVSFKIKLGTLGNWLDGGGESEGNRYWSQTVVSHPGTPEWVLIAGTQDQRGLSGPCPHARSSV